MKILVLGKDYSALRFYQLFRHNNENLVFSLHPEAKNSIPYQSENDIIEFCLENLINFVLITEKKYITKKLFDCMVDNDITIFSPTPEAAEICISKIFAKRFMYKNKIPTSKFFIAEKVPLALDYIKEASFPLAIKPDISEFQESVKFGETFSKTHKIIENLFNSGNKKILIEDYIEGKNISIWTISDGYKANIIGSSAKYQNEVAFFNPSFLTQEIKENIQNSIINPTIEALAQIECEYVGILGFDIILDKNNNPFLIGYNNFFDELNVDFFTQDIDFSYEEIFNSTIAGDIFLNFKELNFTPYAISQRFDDKIQTISANTQVNLKRYIKELELESKDLKEARKIWKN